MPRESPINFRQFPALVAVLPVLWAMGVWAEDLPTTRPLLEGLNRETQTLFKEVAGSIVRVQLPVGRNLMGAPDDPLAKWAGRLDAPTRQRGEELRVHAPASTYHAGHVPSTPHPAGADGGTVILTLSRFVPNAIGLVFDDQQHLL